MNKKKLFCFVAGKSGGHIIPALTLARQHHAQHPDDTLLFITTSNALDQQLIKESALLLSHYSYTLNSPTRWYYYPAAVMRLGYAFVRALALFIVSRPTTIITTGGLIAFPVSLAGWCLRIPFEQHELNYTPGKAVQLLAPLARVTYCSFAPAGKQLPTRARWQQAPYPLRFTEQIDPAHARRHLGIPENAFVLMIIGGSQGSQSLNKVAQEIIAQIHAETIVVIHQTGHAHHDTLKKWYGHYPHIPLHLFDYSADLDYYYTVAHLIITRAGAGTLFEIDFFKKQAIIIPLITKSTDHQRDNARFFAQQSPERYTVLESSDHELASKIIRYIQQ